MTATERPTDITPTDREMVVRLKVALQLRRYEVSLEFVAEDTGADLRDLVAAMTGGRRFDLCALADYFDVPMGYFRYNATGYEEFVVATAHYIEVRPEQRRGQATFNALNEARPELADQLRGTNLDPFYVDDRLPAFWDHLAIVWHHRYEAA